MSAFRLENTPRACERGISELIVGIGDPSKCCLQPKNGQKWFDVKAGDVLMSADGEERTVLKVRLFDEQGAAAVEIKTREMLSAGTQRLENIARRVILSATRLLAEPFGESPGTPEPHGHHSQASGCR